MTARRNPRPPRLLRLALRAFPAGFRRRYGAEMLAVHAERHAAVRRELGRAAARRHLVRVVGDVLASGLAERLARSSVRPRHPHSTPRRKVAMDAWLMDLRYGLRLLRRRPGFALVAVVTLAVGIGSSSAMFTLVKQVALEPLPFPESDRLVRIYDTNRELGWRSGPSSPATFLDWRTELGGTLAGVVATEDDRVTWSGAEPAESIRVLQVSADWFGILGVSPALGRGFTREEEVPGRNRVVVLSHGFWERRLGADPAVLGRTLPLDGEPYTVVGVMPRDFAFPDPETELWLPLSFGFDVPGSRGAHYLTVVARLAPAATLESAGAAMDALMSPSRDRPSRADARLGRPARAAQGFDPG